MKTNVQQSQSSTRISDIPDGFTTRTGPDGQHYLVPQYMVPALDQAFVTYRTKADLGVRNAPAGVSKNFITNGSSRMSVPTAQSATAVIVSKSIFPLLNTGFSQHR